MNRNEFLRQLFSSLKASDAHVHWTHADGFLENRDPRLIHAQTGVVLTYSVSRQEDKKAAQEISCIRVSLLGENLRSLWAKNDKATLKQMQEAIIACESNIKFQEQKLREEKDKQLQQVEVKATERILGEFRGFYD